MCHDVYGQNLLVKIEGEGVTDSIFTLVLMPFLNVMLLNTCLYQIRGLWLPGSKVIALGICKSLAYTRIVCTPIHAFPLINAYTNFNRYVLGLCKF